VNGRDDPVFLAGKFKGDLVSHSNRIGVPDAANPEVPFQPAADHLVSGSDRVPVSGGFYYYTFIQRSNSKNIFLPWRKY
jgi:hypothetical protein